METWMAQCSLSGRWLYPPARSRTAAAQPASCCEMTRLLGLSELNLTSNNSDKLTGWIWLDCPLEVREILIFESTVVVPCPEPLALCPSCVEYYAGYGVGRW